MQGLNSVVKMLGGWVQSDDVVMLVDGAGCGSHCVLVEEWSCRGDTQAKRGNNCCGRRGREASRVCTSVTLYVTYSVLTSGSPAAPSLRPSTSRDRRSWSLCLSMDGLAMSRCTLLVVCKLKGLTKALVSRRNILQCKCAVGCLGQCVMRKSCASVE